MVIIEKRDVVKIVVPPEPEDDTSLKLSQYFQNELDRRQKVEKV